MSRIRWRVGAGRRAGGGAAPGPGARLVGTLCFGLFLGLGVFFLVLVARETRSAAETFRWAERRCEIVRSQVVREGGEKPYRAAVGFRTLGPGAPRAGDALRRRPPAFASHGDAARRLVPYPVGATVPCWVSPAGEAVLERGPLWIALWALLPLVFAAIGAVGLVATWRPARRDRRGRPVPEALGDRAPRGRPGRALVGFGLLLAGAGAVALGFAGVLPLWRVHAARSWERLACSVEHSSVVSHASDEGTTYSVDILYRWERGRGVERSSRYSFFGGSSSGRAGKAAIVRAHPRGAVVPCWVDPGRANEAVLERGLTLHAAVALVPLAILAAGGAMVWAGRRKADRRARIRRDARLGRAPVPPDDPVLDVLPAFEASAGPVSLGARSSRWGRVVGLVCVTLFWNGIVGVFVHEAWGTFERGRPDALLALFLAPFVLVGAGFVLAVFHALLALGNARPALIASTRSPRLGERLDLEWRFRGRTDPLERVRIALRGREQATYQVGTDTRRATETFLEQVLVDVPAPACAMGGHASVTIPDGSMHSFESPHNEVVWELELVGEIRRWPDVKETYPIVVLPHPADGRKPEGS